MNPCEQGLRLIRFAMNVKFASGVAQGDGSRGGTSNLTDTHELEDDISQFASHTIIIFLTSVVKAMQLALSSDLAS